MKNNELTQIKEASFFKRIIAFVMDGAVAAFIMFALVAFVFNPIAEKGFHYSEKRASQLRYEVASKLVVAAEKNEEGNLVYYDLPELSKVTTEADYPLLNEIKDQSNEFYLSRVKYYYLNYKTGNNVDYPESANPEDYKAPNYQELINGVSRSEFYTEEWFLSQTQGKEIADIIVEAMNDLSSETYFADNAKNIRKIGYFIILPPYLLSFTVFFLVIPLCFKNGETLGKKTLHLAFINSEGYAVQKKQIVLRQLSIFLCMSLLCFVIGRIGLGSIAFLGIGILLYYVFAALYYLAKKEIRTPADLIAYTELVDSNKSVWFTDANTEEQKNEEVEKNMENYHKNKVEDPHIIQVDGTIVNEEVKKEFIEQTKNKEK